MSNFIIPGNLVEMVEKELEANGIDEVKCELASVLKNGVELKALVFKKNNATASIYLENIIESCKDRDGDIIWEMVAQKCAIAYENEEATIVYTVESFPEILNDTSSLQVRLYNLERNKDNFEKEGIPYLPFLDLAITLTYQVDVGGRIGIIKVNQSFLEKMGLSFEEALEKARHNRVAEIAPINSVLGPILGVAEEDCPPTPLSVSTTGDPSVDSTFVILQDEELKDYYEKVGEFYIIPSSIHELLFIPVAESDEDILQGIIRDVNQDVLEPTEFLSNNLYRYTGENIEITQVA